jgi:membrane-bound ClpP family serine protease
VRSRLLLLGLLASFLAVPFVASAQEDRVVHIIEVTGVLDGRKADFVVDAIERAATAGNVEVAILQVDSPAAVLDREQYETLRQMIANPPLPLVAWVGEAPAVVSGGVLDLVTSAPLRVAAPGVSAGHWTGGPDFEGASGQPPSAISTAGMATGLVTVDAPVPGVFDLVQAETASPRQVAQALDGMTVAGEQLSTLRPFTDADGTTGITLLTTVIQQPGYWTQLLGLASRPEALFFFLVVGLTIAAFEFYAIGPGIASGVAAACLALAAAGMTVLPVRLPVLALVVGAIWLLSVSYQRGGVVALSGLGLLGLVVGGFTLTDAAPQVAPSVVGVLLTIASAAFFFLLAMPVVARSRFSTQTIGREGLIGREGVATVDFGPDGEVEVDGGRWKATAHRESGIRAGDPLTVTAIDGWYLEVAPKDREK